MGGVGGFPLAKKPVAVATFTSDDGERRRRRVMPLRQGYTDAEAVVRGVWE